MGLEIAPANQQLAGPVADGVQINAAEVPCDQSRSHHSIRPGLSVGHSLGMGLHADTSNLDSQNWRSWLVDFLRRPHSLPPDPGSGERWVTSSREEVLQVAGFLRCSPSVALRRIAPEQPGISSGVAQNPAHALVGKKLRFRLRVGSRRKSMLTLPISGLNWRWSPRCLQPVR
jgi:hypothetical protein